ncbi:Peptidase S51 [Cordyceps fumosorosea ARSEF 2679]|uniref:Peptidase S51 n=1 Tax=Cordyceps fumosorosea (strain ARSEF 2679) TaxID=1081104 RepID=A0A162IDS1_CORFA|nr:Peptidase S51 [Cordyceps fumosorosea ARSEF 2679]OAA55715.1 Peptidase S51 [Cordyceps fumosorosea ARSEF 2679]
MPSTRWLGTKEWITRSLARFGAFSSISLGFSGPDFGLGNADVVAIPGGNTFRLLHHLREHDLLRALRVFLDQGGRIYGGSAGALVLGASIAIADSSVGGQDDNIVGDLLVDMQGLDALRGCVAYPHFEQGVDRFEGHCHRWSQEHGVTVIGIPETCGVQFDPSGCALNAGPSPAYVFTSDGRRTV